MYKIKELALRPLGELTTIAEKLQVPDYQTSDKQALIYKILDQQALVQSKETTDKVHTAEPKKEKWSKDKKANGKHTNTPSKKRQSTKQTNDTHTSQTQETSDKPLTLQDFSGLISGEGVLDTIAEGYGFLRSADYNYLSSPDDIYVPHHFIKTWGLRKGDTIAGKLRPPKENEKYFGLVEITTVNGQTLEHLRTRRDFQHLLPIYPDKKLQLTHKPNAYGTRIMDMFVPVGYGQRFTILAPPKAGKTSLLKEIATGISQNHPEAYLIILMIGERPEEVTDMQRSIRAEVIASTFDEEPENHIKVAEMAMYKAQRMVESGHNVIIMLDSLTRLVRAYNVGTSGNESRLSGGLKESTIQKCKSFFGKARNIERGGSLTIFATALVDTGSRLDEIILEEFRGTGNAVLHLSLHLANKGIYPPIDILRSSTRRAEDLLSKEQLKYINMMRRVMADMNNPEEALKFILDNIKGTNTNEEFLASIHY